MNDVCACLVYNSLIILFLPHIIAVPMHACMHIHSGTLYTYLAGEIGWTTQEGSFRAFQQGYNHWAFGHLEKIVCLNVWLSDCLNPKYAHVRCKLKLSMKDGNYSVGLLLGRSNDNTSILRATCQCVAGYVNFLIAIILYLLIHTGCIYIVNIQVFMPRCACAKGIR